VFALTQRLVNFLPPGRYIVVAGYTTRIESAYRLAEVASRLVSNVDQYDIIIEELTRPCGTQQVAGGDTPDTRVFDMNNIGGTFRFDFQTFSIKDQMIVRYQGNPLFDTGCVGTSGSKLIEYHGSSTKIEVEVKPNCPTGQGTGTLWNYTVQCPVP
jgi:hypothetical protein